MGRALRIAVRGALAAAMVGAGVPVGHVAARVPAASAAPPALLASSVPAVAGSLSRPADVPLPRPGPADTSGAARPDSGSDVRVLVERDRALREIFGHPARAVEDRWRLTPAEVRAIEEEAHDAVPDTAPATLRVYGEGDRLLGYAMVLDEKGKYRPITFVVATGPELAVREVQVLVYREDRGGEVASARFLRQYRGKTASDPVRTHRDIVNITGATISVNALNDGVRRALATLGALYGRAGGEPVSSRPVPLPGGG